MLNVQELSKLSAKAMELSDEGVVITDADATILFANPAMCKITGYEYSQIIGKTPRMFKSGHHGEQFYKQMWSSLRKHGVWQGEILDRKRCGEITARQLRIKAIRDSHQETTHFIGLMHDNSQLKMMTELANRDPLTGLPNRRVFDERLCQAAARSRRSGKAFALLYIDLDDFKKINDNWGHLTGDKVLITVATRLKASVRADDTVVRLGGDEFAIILSEVGSDNNVGVVMDKIFRRVKKTSIIDQRVLNMDCSIGYSLFPDHTQDINVLLEMADRNMFAQKNGRHHH